MANIVEAPDWTLVKRGIRTAGTSMYPYKEWFDGQAWQLTFGEGGDVPTAKQASWINSAKTIASQKFGLTLKSRVNEDGTVTIQAIPKTAPAAAPEAAAASASDDLTV